MINFFKAIEKLLNNCEETKKYITQKKEDILLSLNNYNHNNIYSNENIPSFKNSAVDGYAIHINNDIKKYFKIKKTIHAGDFYNNSIKKKNNAIEIMTGAKIPRYYNAVVKIEDVTYINNLIIKIKKKIKKNENIKFIGEDFKKNDLILKKNTILNSFNILALATFGIKSIYIKKKPKIYLIATGNEIVEEKTNFNKNFLVYNSSSYYIISVFKNRSYDLIYLGLIKDHEMIFIEKIKKILTLKYINLFITTGAVSKGKRDFIPEIFKKLGIKILFHKIDIKPGKPLLFAKYKKHIYFFSLPGNPVSSIIGYRFFITAFIDSIMMQNLEEPIKCILKNDIKTIFKKDTFLKARNYIEKSKIKVKILAHQESFKVKSLLNSTSFVFIKKNNIIKKNKFVNVYFENQIYLKEKI